MARSAGSVSATELQKGVEGCFRDPEVQAAVVPGRDDLLAAAAVAAAAVVVAAATATVAEAIGLRGWVVKAAEC